MLRCTVVRHASKVSGGSAKNQAGSPRRMAKEFQVFLNAPASTMEPLKMQRHRYGQDKHSRSPEFRAGANVTMDNRFTLHATTPGIVSVRPSRINPEFKWVDIDPDIQKHRRARELRAELKKRGMTHSMIPAVSDYKGELDNLQEPQWREDALKVKKPTERFVDPNLFTRGIIAKLTPDVGIACE